MNYFIDKIDKKYRFKSLLYNECLKKFVTRVMLTKSS